jgi:ribonucleotide monophosphatase NagD (HAD superfamily)
VPKERILAIGDGADTDLLGAHRAGLASVFIASSVHLPGGLRPQALEKLFQGRPYRPIAALPALS